MELAPLVNNGLFLFQPVYYTGWCLGPMLCNIISRRKPLQPHVWLPTYTHLPLWCLLCLSLSLEFSLDPSLCQMYRYKGLPSLPSNNDKSNFLEQWTFLPFTNNRPLMDDDNLKRHQEKGFTICVLKHCKRFPVKSTCRKVPWIFHYSKPLYKFIFICIPLYKQAIELSERQVNLKTC